MNQLFLILIAGMLCMAARAQNQPPATIDHLQASYQSVPSTSIAIVNGQPQIRVKPQLTVTLKAGASASKIYLEMLDAQNNSIYAVSYVIGSGPVSDEQGHQLFYTDESGIHINNPNTAPLAPYTYKLHTEDSQGIASAEFSTIQ